MKREAVFLFLLVVCSSLVFAEITVNDYNINDVFSSKEIITGKINLTILDEPYNTEIKSNDDDEMVYLGDFLNLSGASFECSPFDCSPGLTSTDTAVDGSFSLAFLEKKSLGFIFEGEDIEIKSLYFGIDSNFSQSARRPLSIDFFGEEEWGFEEFSNTFLVKDYGCYDIRSDSVGVGPLIGDEPYCEIIYISETDKINVGAGIEMSEEDANLTISICLEGESCDDNDECEYSPYEGEEGCTIDEGLIFPAGNYEVCVSSEDTTYNIYIEDSGDTCGSFRGEDTNTDYAIFARGVEYSNNTFLEEYSVVPDGIVSDANDFLEENYDNDCTNGCVLPLIFSGIDQEIIIKNISIEYTSDQGNFVLNKIYELEESDVTVNFDGVANLDVLNFSVSKSMNYLIFIGDEDINKTFDVSEIPEITSIYPKILPAGVPIIIYAGVNFSSNKSLTYNWDFGDDNKETTFEPYVAHAYGDLGDYNLSVEVSAGGALKSNRSFTIKAISPQVAIEDGLTSKTQILDNMKKIIEGAQAWFRGELSVMASIESLSDNLSDLSDNKELAVSDEDFLKIAEELYGIEMPTEIKSNKFNNPYLINSLDDVNIEPISTVTGILASGTSEDYANPILSWQNKNIEASYSREVYEVVFRDDADFLSAYVFNIKSNSFEDSYFVIDVPFSDLHFSGDAGALEADDFTVIPIPANGEKSFKFYYNEPRALSYFGSPRLSSILLDVDIDTSCNYNSFCEEDLGETSETCRSDCKPIKTAIVYGIIIVIAILLIYTALQFWYNRRYESYLFKSNKELYNLLMFIANARTRGMNNFQISNNLKKQGWSSERVSFAIKKSEGKRTGLFEIIPISKISAAIVNSKIKKDQAAAANVPGPNNLPPPINGPSGVPPSRPRSGATGFR